MSLNLLFKKKNAKIGNITLDASLEETHSRSAEVTDHPVETGSPVSDHVRPLPEQVTIKGIITNHPLKLLASLSTSPTRAQDSYRDLVDLLTSGTLVKIVTTLKEYDDMVMTSIDVPRSASLGNVVQFTAQFKKIITAQSRQVNAPPPPDKATPEPKQKNLKKPTNNGTKTTTPATPQVQQQASGLYNLLGL